MALIDSTYRGYKLLNGQHVETMFPGLLRSVTPPAFETVRITTPDDDFLDLDYYRSNANKLVIVSHGLEGNSQKPYMQGLAKACVGNGFDVICWNYRGCSGEMNKQPRLYHSGATDDLQTVITYALATGQYQSVALVGFSLGGNITLKYMGEQGTNLHPVIKAAVTFSTPLDLSAGSDRISEPDNWLYEYRFLKKLKAKLRLKQIQFPDKFNLHDVNNVTKLREFDDKYTGPLHGFKDANDYYAQCSSIRFVSSITRPTLIVNAKNDPFLPKECYPYELLKEHRQVTLETPDRGGHVGFFTVNNDGIYWSDERAIKFISTHFTHKPMLH